MMYLIWTTKKTTYSVTDHWKVKETITDPVAMSTPSVHIMISKYHFPLKVNNAF